MFESWNGLVHSGILVTQQQRIQARNLKVWSLSPLFNTHVFGTIFFFQDSKCYGPKTVLYSKNPWKPTFFIEQKQGKGDLETMVMREVNRISKKSKKHFFSLKKKGYLKKWDLTFLWKTMIHIYENDITDQIRLWLAF